MKTKEITGKKRRREDATDAKEAKKEITFSQKTNMLNKICKIFHLKAVDLVIVV